MAKERNADRVIQVKDRSIGLYMKELRNEYGFKQSDLVIKLQTEGVDISVFSYCRIEKGKQNPTVSLLYALCSIYNCDMNRIFGLDI